MSFFLVFLAIVLVGAVVWASLGRRVRGTNNQPLPALLDGGFEQPPANLPPVLLPANATAGDVDQIRFSLGLRGYRMDQVDQVLDELRDQLAARQQEVEDLRARLRALEDHGQGDGGGQGDRGTSQAVTANDGGPAVASDAGNAAPGKSGL